MLWGGAHVQRAPEAAVPRPRQTTETVIETQGRDWSVAREVTKTVTDWPAARLVSTDAEVALDLEHRQKGLLWYDTFDGHVPAAPMSSRIQTTSSGRCDSRSRSRAEHAIYDDFTITVDGVSDAAARGDLAKELITDATVAPRGRATLVVSYRSRGHRRLAYAFVPSGVADVRDFELVDATPISAPSIFPAGTMSPTDEGRNRRRLAADVALHEPGHRAGRSAWICRTGINPGPLAVADHLLCAGLAALLPDGDGRPRRAFG